MRPGKSQGLTAQQFLQKIRSLYEAHAPFRTASLQRWEQQHMAREDKNRNRPSHWAGWERQQMAMEDENKHRPLHLQERNPTASLECLGAAADGIGRQERTSTKEHAKKESYCSFGVLGAAEDGHGRQEQT